MVLHRPSGETWLVAAIHGGEHFFACGWPETLARIADADLVETCSDDEHLDVLRRVAEVRGDDGQLQARACAARRNLAAEGVQPPGVHR